MKILIYDDSNEDVENLKNCLDNFMSKKQIAYQVDVCQDSNYFLQEMEQYASKHPFLPQWHFFPFVSIHICPNSALR